MLPVLTAAQMRGADRFTIERAGVPGATLMENAGAAVARVVRERFPKAQRTLVLCGRGHNGGDGFVVARHLVASAPLVVLMGTRADVSGDPRAHLEALERAGGTVVEAPTGEALRALVPRLREADLVVDALVGTGLSRAPEGVIADAIAVARAAAAAGVPVVAVDLPSGVPSDDGRVDWPVVEATVTVTFAAPKHGHVQPPACDHVGELVVADIGIAAEGIPDSGIVLLEPADAAAAFPRRPRAAHKGTFGHVLVLGGSPGKTGATVLAARGAFAAGAGLVTIATVAATRPLVVAVAPAEVMTADLGAAFDGDAAARALELAAACTAVVLGPGLGDPAARPFARTIAAGCATPMVIDAGAIAAIAEAGPGALRPGRPTILTPHPGEMTALSGTSRDEVQAGRFETAREAASSTGAIVVLKGQRTLVADPAGRVAVNPTGNPGMATAGTGDVLAGMAGALLARGLPAWTAATAAVYLHGAAGDEAVRWRGEESMVAGDLVAATPAALRAIVGR
jgi:NAD(P)H-hydrate epimerase